MIPKKIWTIWLNDNPELPELIKRCIETHKVEGWEHELITFDNLPLVQSNYFHDCLDAKKWVKASDYLRMWLLYGYGGIYLDADIELKGIPEDMLNNELFACQEENGIFANGVVGSIKGHPLLKEYLRRVDENFKGDGDLVFEPGIRAFADLIWLKRWDVKVYPPEYFFKEPYQFGKHYEMKTWIK